MKYLSIFIPIVLGLLPAFGNGHHMVSNMIIDGVDQGMGKCVRVAKNNSPVTDVNSPDMTCNAGTKPVERACIANVGSTITFVWRAWADGSQAGSISHPGPCAVYMKKVNDATKSPGTGLGWFKIYHDGYHDGKWCSERIAQNDGKMTVKIPKDISGGNYLIRAESLALHVAFQMGGAQWYMACGQLIINAACGKANPSIVSIPGYVKASDPGVHYDLYGTNGPRLDDNKYIIPGPKPYVSKPFTSCALEHRRERGDWNCVVENANWCARPVPGFTDEAGCFKSAQKCWDQLKACYDCAPASGNKGCAKYEKICQRYADYCNSCGNSCHGKFPDN